MLTQFCLLHLDLFGDFKNLRGIFRVLPSCFLRLGDLLLKPVPVLVEAVDHGAAISPLGVQLDHLIRVAVAQWQPVGAREPKAQVQEIT